MSKSNSGSYPRGAVIHFTAGRAGSEDEAKATFDWLQKNGLKAVVIGPLGKCYFPEDWETKWGPHAGKSYHPALGEGVSRYLIGFEVACEGKLELRDGKFYSWFGTVVPSERVNTYTQRMGNIEAGHYAAFTPQQVERLVELLCYLKDKYPSFDFDLVVGHDEVATPKGRKNDPGGSIGMTMEQFRSFLKATYVERKNKANGEKKEGPIADATEPKKESTVSGVTSSSSKRKSSGLIHRIINFFRRAFA